MNGRPSASALPADFFARPADVVARELLGAVLVSLVDGERVSGRIVETEAYVGPHDPASHAAARIGRTARNAAMYGPPGTAYVYRIYGIHWCLNAVTDREGYPAAVLIRAVQPEEGLEIMARRRGLGHPLAGNGGFGPRPARRSGAARGEGRALAHGRALAGGPGRLARALGITGALDRHALDVPPLLVLPGDSVADADVARGPRIGVTLAADWPLRFFVRDNPYVSQ